MRHVVRPLLLGVTLCLLALNTEAAELKEEASMTLTNRQGQNETWVLLETITGDATDRTVRRTYRREGAAFYTEESRTLAGTLVSLTVSDARPGGENVDIQVHDGAIRYRLGDGEAERVEKVTGEVLAAGQIGPRLADLLRADGALATHRFRVPIPKALKSAPMQARITSRTAEQFTVELRSTDLLIQTFFMRESFVMEVHRASGRVLRFVGQPEPYDLSSGSARSVKVTYRFQPYALPNQPLGDGS